MLSCVLTIEAQNRMVGAGNIAKRGEWLYNGIMEVTVMKRWMAFLLALLLCGSAFAETDYLAAGEMYMQMLAEGRYEEICECMTPEMQAVLMADGLAQSMEALGGLVDQLPAVLKEEQGYHVAEFGAEHETGLFTYSIVMDDDAKLAGLSIRPAQSLAAPLDADWQDIAEGYMEQLKDGDIESVWQQMTGEMQEALPLDALVQTLNALGEIRTYEFSESTAQSGIQIVRFDVEQGAAWYQYNWMLDAEMKIAGLQVMPGSAPVKTAEEIPADLHVETVLLRPGQADETEALLTLPAAEGTFPAVILVHGSGPNDRDESVYGMTPLKDLAEGLARMGIASIRYDKYTYAHADQISDPASFTVEQEYIADAREALAALENDPRISDIYLAGHSQGGMLMPRIIAELGRDRFAGGIAIAGSPLHMWEIQHAQNVAILDTLSGEEKAQARAVIDAELAKLELLPGWTDDERRQNTFFGVSAYYQWDDMSCDAGELAAQNGLPMLMLQGDADWQVMLENGVHAWQKVCPDADYAVLENVTHMLNRVDTVTGTTADYVPFAKVDPTVIEAIGSWILWNE